MRAAVIPNAGQKIMILSFRRSTYAISMVSHLRKASTDGDVLEGNQF